MKRATERTFNLLIKLATQTHSTQINNYNTMSGDLDNWDDCSSDDEISTPTPPKQTTIHSKKAHVDVPEYIQNMKISVVLDDLLENIPKSSVQHVYAGTGTGKTAGISVCLLLASLAGEIKYTKIIVAIPTIVNVLSQYNYAVSQNKDIKEHIGYKCNGKYSDNYATANLVYVTTRVAFDTITNTNKHTNTIVLIDEAHLPSMENYIMQAYANSICDLDTSPCFIVASATPPANSYFTKLYDTTHPNIKVDSTQFNVEWNFDVNTHLKSDVDKWIEETLLDALKKNDNTINQIMNKNINSSNVLIFSKSINDVERIVENLKKNVFLKNVFQVLGMHSGLSNLEMENALADSKRRKIIVATNCAETGITIPNTSIVIDTCTSMQIVKKTDNVIVETINISQKEMIQRAGRAGRTSSGNYYPYCSKSEYKCRQCDPRNQFHLSLPHGTILDLIDRNINPNILMIQQNILSNVYSSFVDAKMTTQTNIRPHIHFVTDSSTNTINTITPLGKIVNDKLSFVSFHCAVQIVSLCDLYLEQGKCSQENIKKFMHCLYSIIACDAYKNDPVPKKHFMSLKNNIAFSEIDVLVAIIVKIRNPLFRSFVSTFNSLLSNVRSFIFHRYEHRLCDYPSVWLDTEEKSCSKSTSLCLEKYAHKFQIHTDKKHYVAHQSTKKYKMNSCFSGSAMMWNHAYISPNVFSASFVTFEERPESEMCLSFPSQNFYSQQF